MFDYFCIVGVGGSDCQEISDTTEASILFCYPPSLPSDLEREVPSFCYPVGVPIYGVQQSSKLGEIADIVYGKHYDLRSDKCFVFQLKITGEDKVAPETLYGICCYRKEFTHRLPAIAIESEGPKLIPDNLQVSTRCYCILSRVPLFEQHFVTLKRIVSFERHTHIQEYVQQIDQGLWGSSFSENGVDDASNGLDMSLDRLGDVSSCSESDKVESKALSPRADSAGNVLLQNSSSEFDTPEDIVSLDILTPSAPLLDASATPFYTAETGRQGARGSSTSPYRTMSRVKNYAGEAEDLELVKRNLASVTLDDVPKRALTENESISLELGSWIEADNDIEDSDSIVDTGESNSKSSIKPRKSGAFSSSGSWEHPLEFLQAYRLDDYRTRAKEILNKEIVISDQISLRNKRGEFITRMTCNMSAIDFLAAKEVEGWAICALCRSLSVENIITYLTATLLERQIVVFNPNIGTLSGIVLSLLPLLTPFSWQSLLLPILPDSPEKVELLEAPVPFVVGSLIKSKEIRSKAAQLVRVNAYKDNIKNAHLLPRLPRAGRLALSLYEIHDQIRQDGMRRAADAHPIYETSTRESDLAAAFVKTVSHHLMSLTSEMAGYMITDVSAPSGSEQRCSILLKESFVESFDDPKDREFMSEFVETQMFDMYVDYFS